MKWAVALSFLLAGVLNAAEPLPEVKEGFSSLSVRASAPVPEEVSNQSQALALSREAAVVRGQTALLTYVLQKKAHSKKTLAEAEIPSIELQQSIRGYIKGAKVTKTQWLSNECHVTLSLSKSQLKTFLRKN